MGQPNSIIVLLNIIKEYAKEDTFLWVCQSLTDNGLGNQADFELHMIAQYPLQILGYHDESTD